MSQIIADFLWILDSPINYNPYKERSVADSQINPNSIQQNCYKIFTI